MRRSSINGITWVVAQVDDAVASRLANELSIPPLLARLLVIRQVRTGDEGRRFLNPSLGDLTEPGELPGAMEAAHRIADAVKRAENIVIYGDYDVDGTSAVGLLVRCLKMVGANVSYYVPHRLDEGYGLNMDAMRKIVAAGTQLVVSVDCGVTAFEEAQYLAENGIDLVITDHHEPMGRLPRASAIVNPKVAGAPGLRNSSGVGVAFKVAWAVAQIFSPGRKVTEEFREFLCDSLALVALGTIADVVPLTGENRVLVRYGLNMLKSSRMPGLQSLVVSAQLPEGPVVPRHVAFQVAPLLNAAGRMGDARTSVELFVTEETVRADKLATELERHNKNRKLIGSSMLSEAMEEAANFEDSPALILARPQWHSGVIGIVAGKLAESFYKPAAVIATEGGIGQGSARSIPEVNVFEAIGAASDLLISYGGHAQAAGFKIRTENIERFREALCANVGGALGGCKPEPTLKIDAEVSLADLSVAAVREIERLAPFGQGNQRPVLAVRDVEIIGEPRRMGSDGQHVSFYVRKDVDSLRAVGFGFPHFERIARGTRCDLAFQPRINRWNGKTSVELILKDIAFDGK